MTDTPTPPEASGADPTREPLAPETAPRQRWWDWRPKLRWFAAEIVVVVAGVLIALALNAWWGARQDRAQEQVYLLQLAADLHETQALLADGDARAVGPDAATRRLYDAFYAPQRPPRDSLLRWVYRTSWIWPVRPVLGTAEALVTTGDLALVRDDSLRSAITAYLDDSRRLMVVHDGNVERWVNHSDQLMTQIDRSALLGALDPDQIESLRDSPTWSLADGEQRDPFPFSPETFLTDRETYAALLGMADMKQNLGAIRRMLRRRTDSLQTLVETQLAP